MKALKKDTIIYIPYAEKGSITNEHEINKIDILKEKYIVTGELADPMDIELLVRTRAVFLNWAEEKLDKKIKFQLYLHKIFGAKIIWVFHNKFPHEAAEGDILIKKNMKWLADRASYIMLHSKSSERYIPAYKRNRHKKRYVPHMIFEKRLPAQQMDDLRKKYNIDKNDFIFTMFGFLRPYKHYEEGIKAFKQLDLKNVKMILAGSTSNVKYAQYLKELCKDDRKIILDIGYIPNMKLDAIIGISDVIVIPYINGSSMNSGVMIQAFSNQKTVIIPNICMARDFAEHGFLYRYGKDLKKAMLKAYNNGKEINRQMGNRAYEYVRKNNNRDIVKDKLYSMLEEK